MDVLSRKVRHLVDEDATVTSIGSNISTFPLDVVTPSQHQPLTATEILMVFFLLVIDLTTILGNLLVCVTIVLVRRLHTVTNYLVCTLAMCDLLLGCLVLPFSIIITVSPDSWPFSASFCNVYVSNDVALCTVSILTLLVIGIDRYVAVVYPFLYSRLTADRRLVAVLQVAAGVWIFSFAMAYIPIHLGWNTDDGTVQNRRIGSGLEIHDPSEDEQSQQSMSSSPPSSTCVFEHTSVWYVMFVAVGTYFCPLVVLCAVYIRVFAIARRQIARIRKMTSVTGNSCRQSEVRKLVVNDESGTTTAVAASSLIPAASTTSMVSETKATVTLGSVVLAFAVCWVPYFVLFAARPFVVGGFDPTLDLFVLWLGYANSMLNPFLYAFYGSEFRHGFYLVLCRWRQRSGSGNGGLPGSGLRGFRDPAPEAYYL